MTKFFASPRAIAAGAVFAIGLGSLTSALAVVTPVFTINPTAYYPAGSVFQADTANGGSTTLITALGGNTYSSDGYIQYTGMSLLGNQISAFTTGIGAYGLYATFNQTFTCTGGLSIGTTCTVNTISLGLYIDPGFKDTFVQASLGVTPSVTDVGGNDVLIATVNTVVNGTAGINALGGAFENVNTNFMLTPTGASYFTAPVPFYNLSFNEFNNTSSGLSCAPATTPACSGTITQVAVTSESGAATFAQVPTVPEPASLALVGSALVGLALARRKTKARK